MVVLFRHSTLVAALCQSTYMDAKPLHAASESGARATAGDNRRGLSRHRKPNCRRQDRLGCAPISATGARERVLAWADESASEEDCRHFIDMAWRL
jgi:hypothetical protein